MLKKMDFELIVFLVMVGIFMISCFKFNTPVGIAMMLSSMGGLVVGTKGFDYRHLIEGGFAYIDTILVIATAMLFMKSVTASGVLGVLNYNLVKKFHTQKSLLLIMLMFVIMFPGMVTGSSTAAVLAAGGLVAPVLINLGIPLANAGAILAMGGLLGMIAPPVNLPAMIIGGGIDMPYSGFGLPLLFVTIPVAIFSVLYLSHGHLKSELNFEELEKNLNIDANEKQSPVLYLPLILLFVLLVGGKMFPMTILNMGMPLTFLVCTVVALFTGKKFNIVEAASDAIADVLPVLSILIGVGMFIQVMTLTGVRGFIVYNSLGLPLVLLYVAIAVMLPLFGAVSSFGAASVLGVPFLMSLITKNPIITASGLSLIAALGDLMPPTALAGIFAAKVVGVEDYTIVLKKTAVPALAVIVMGLLTIIFANPISEILL